MVSKRSEVCDSDDAACTRGVLEVRLIVGIDVSKDKLDLCWLKDEKSNKKKTKVFKNNPTGHKEVKRWLLKNIQATSEEILITMEPTGVYHETLIYFLHKQGFNIFLANPGKAKKYADAIGLIHKTDKSDAAMLARYGLSQSQSIQLWQPEEPAMRELKAIMRRVDALEKDLQREKNRKESSELGAASPRVLSSLDKIITALEVEIDKLTSDIDNHIDQHPQMKKNRKLLESIKGIGSVMSREMVYLLATKKFSTAKQVAAYLGVIPRLQESGKWKGHTTLSKLGPARVRAKLYMAAISASTYNPDIKRQKDRLLEAGKTPMQALGAAMRKLVQICFGVIKHQSEYQPQAI